MSKTTPMLQQFLEIKEQYPDCILFYRVGDFYEMFYQDAVDASDILDITLTKKRMGTDIEPAPLCGVPHHAAESYLARLLAAGRKVAICDQTEDPALAKGLVRREVTRVITPGTMTSELMLSPGESNYLACVYFGADGIGLAYTDITTGEFETLAFAGDTAASNERALLHEIARLEPAEILLACEDADETEDRAARLKAETGASIEVLSDLPAGAAVMDRAVSGMIGYLGAIKATESLSEGDFKIHVTQGRMVLDRTAARNLELTESMYEKTAKGSLLGVLDRTKTALGARRLKSWIREPLIRCEEIDARLDAVAYLLDAFLVRNDLREILKSVYDIERLMGRINAGTANGRDLISLKISLGALPELRFALTDTEMALLRELTDALGEHDALCGLIADALLEEQPLSTQSGGLIREGYSRELDDLKAGISGGKQWIAELEQTERERTGIKSLKVRYNRVQGYYIEVTKTNLDMVPEDYVRKQTLVNAERFITPELKRIESTVLSAESNINALEYEIFSGICLRAAETSKAIRDAAAAVAKLDALLSLAQVAQENGYVRPVVTEGDRITIIRGRHPVIERTTFAGGGAFVPNDTELNLNDQSMLLITGPNMAGKSTFMRQTALIVLMAQMGCFVPADSAEIGICDRIFTRIGASDNIAREQSTFLVEMNELSDIVSEYTSRSLIILDEIGRGTSTYDGLAIAWATIDYLCGEGRRARTMFATHYHELTALEGVLPGLVNLSTQVDDTAESVVYLHKVEAGAMGRSYGIHVAKMAGLPEILLDDAQEKLTALENEAKEIQIADPASVERQTSFLKFSPMKEENKAEIAQNEALRRIQSKLSEVNVLEITPSAAIALIESLKKEVEES